MTTLSISKKDASDLITNNNINLIPFNTETDAALYLKQMELEQDMMVSTQLSYFENLEKTIERGEADETTYGRFFLSNYVHQLSEHIDAWKHEAKTKKGGGRKHIVLSYLDLLDTRVIATITLSTLIAYCAKEDTPATVAYFRIANRIEDELNLSDIRKQDKTLFKKMKSAIANKREYDKKSSAVKYLSRLSDYNRVEWSKNVKVQLGSKLLEFVLESCDLFEQKTLSRYSVKKYKTETPYYIYLTDSTYEAIKEHTEEMSSYNTTYRPMCVPPIDWNKGMVRGGGYLTAFVTPLKFAKTHTYRSLNEYKNIDMPLVLDAMNAAQRTPWRVNKDVLKLLDYIQGNDVALKKLDLTLKPRPEKPLDIAELSKAAMVKKEIEDYNRENEKRIDNELEPLAIPSGIVVPDWYDSLAEKRYFDYRKRRKHGKSRRNEFSHTIVRLQILKRLLNSMQTLNVSICLIHLIFVDVFIVRQF